MWNAGFRAPLTAERIRQVAEFLGVKSGQLLVTAAMQKKVFEFDVSGATPTELRALSGMARGGVTEQQWEEILGILGEEDVCGMTNRVPSGVRAQQSRSYGELEAIAARVRSKLNYDPGVPIIGLQFL